MPKTWLEALNDYKYPSKCQRRERSADFPISFHIPGNRATTIDFENHFRERAPSTIEVWYEVAFWKLYSQSRSWGRVRDIIDYTQANKITPQRSWEAIQNFVRASNRSNLSDIRRLLGIRTDVLAVPLTFVAFAVPNQFPMIDNRVANWVNENMLAHNANRAHKLTRFSMNYTSLRDNDFKSYLNWVAWCREVATVLSRMTDIEWRARDVEMAVFTADNKKLNLCILP